MPAPSGCHGNGAQHCCYLPGGVADPAGSDQPVCPFLEQNTVPGRRWACGLLRRLGTWDQVHNSEPYRDRVRPVFAELGVAHCGDFRVEGQCCFGPDNPPLYNQDE